jgi:hypothetical protein
MRFADLKRLTQWSKTIARKKWIEHPKTGQISRLLSVFRGKFSNRSKGQLAEAASSLANYARAMQLLPSLYVDRRIRTSCVEYFTSIWLVGKPDRPR